MKNNSKKEKIPKTHWYKKLLNKYRLIILNQNTFEERFSIKLTRLNVFITIGALMILLSFIIFNLIAYTPLREYIPGYNSFNIKNDLYELQLKTDSINDELKAKEQFLNNILGILKNDKALNEDFKEQKKDTTLLRNNIFQPKQARSKEDSILRAEYEEYNKYSLQINDNQTNKINITLSKLRFYTPLKGIITNSFDTYHRHFGIDIASNQNKAIMATYDGTVILTGWTSETGYIIVIQHPNNIASVYKHNSSLLCKQGSYVKAGEPISIIGNSGSLTTGPHLHFELWINGIAVNPEDYMSFNY